MNAGPSLLGTSSCPPSRPLPASTPPSTTSPHHTVSSPPPTAHPTLPLPAAIAAHAQAHANVPASLSPLLALAPVTLSAADASPAGYPRAATPPAHILAPASPPQRKDTNSSVSTQVSAASMGSTETSNTSYSAEASPNLHQSIAFVKDGFDSSNTRRASRRRTGPLSQQSRERAALIRKLGACNDCRRRRVACHPNHHGMTWEDVVHKFHRAHSPIIQDIAPSFVVGRPLSPAPTMTSVQSMSAHEPQQMDIDSSDATHHQVGRPPLSEARLRTPLPSGPRLDKALSLPGIESLKNGLQNSSSPRFLSTGSCSRYIAVDALLLYWLDDDDPRLVEGAAQELASVFASYYHYSFKIRTIPSSSEANKSSWRWLARQLTDFAEERDQRDVLKIVYYAGHTYRDFNGEMILASSRNMVKASTIRWSGIQTILEEARADTLIIMDAAYYPSARIVRQQGVLELIAASVCEDHYRSLGRCAFTKALAEQLRKRAILRDALSVAELHSLLLAHYPKMIDEGDPASRSMTNFPAPLHAMTSGNLRLPSIYLSPLAADRLRSGFAFENNPQLHISIRLEDANVDVDAWNEWLRLMPDGIKDAKVDGPFQPAFR